MVCRSNLNCTKIRKEHALRKKLLGLRPAWRTDGPQMCVVNKKLSSDEKTPRLRIQQRRFGQSSSVKLYYAGNDNIDVEIRAMEANVMLLFYDVTATSYVIGELIAGNTIDVVIHLVTQLDINRCKISHL